MADPLTAADVGSAAPAAKVSTLAQGVTGAAGSTATAGTATPGAVPVNRGWRAQRATASAWRRAAAIAGFFVVWQVSSLIAATNLLPPPALVARTLVDMAQEGLLTDNARITFTRAFLGLAIAIVVGISLGVAMARNRVIEATLEPFLAAFYPVPKLALYPVLILLLGFGAGSKIALVAMECAYPIIYNTFSGVQGIRKQYFWVAHNVGASRAATTMMAMRAASPSVLAGLRIALPVMLVVIVVTELLGESVGLGYLIRQAGTDFEPERALAIILLLGIVGFVLDRLLALVTRRVVFWQRGVEL